MAYSQRINAKSVQLREALLLLQGNGLSVTENCNGVTEYCNGSPLDILKGDSRIGLNQALFCNQSKKRAPRMGFEPMRTEVHGLSRPAR